MFGNYAITDRASSQLIGPNKKNLKHPVHVEIVCHLISNINIKSDELD